MWIYGNVLNERYVSYFLNLFFQEVFAMIILVKAISKRKFRKEVAKK